MNWRQNKHPYYQTYGDMRGMARPDIAGPFYPMMFSALQNSFSGIGGDPFGNSVREAIPQQKTDAEKLWEDWQNQKTTLDMQEKIATEKWDQYRQQHGFEPPPWILRRPRGR